MWILKQKNIIERESDIISFINGNFRRKRGGSCYREKYADFRFISAWNNEFISIYLNPSTSSPQFTFIFPHNTLVIKLYKKQFSIFTYPITNRQYFKYTKTRSGIVSTFDLLREIRNYDELATISSDNLNIILDLVKELNANVIHLREFLARPMVKSARNISNHFLSTIQSVINS